MAKGRNVRKRPGVDQAASNPAVRRTSEEAGGSAIRLDASPTALLRLQQLAGNGAAVAVVQRETGIPYYKLSDESESSPEENEEGAYKWNPDMSAGSPRQDPPTLPIVGNESGEYSTTWNVAGLGGSRQPVPGGAGNADGAYSTSLDGVHLGGSRQPVPGAVGNENGEYSTTLDLADLGGSPQPGPQPVPQAQPSGPDSWKHAASRLNTLEIGEKYKDERQGSDLAFQLRSKLERHNFYLQGIISAIEAAMAALQAEPAPKSKGRKAKKQPDTGVHTRMQAFTSLKTQIQADALIDKKEPFIELIQAAQKGVVAADIRQLRGAKEEAWRQKTARQTDLIHGQLRADTLDEAKKYKVRYDTEEDMEKTKVTLGSTLSRDGQPFDTSKSYSNFSKVGWAIFVMLPNGDVHAASHKVSRYHHSSLAGGGTVACAGEIRVEQGVITGVTGKSGHYLPSPEQFIVLFLRLQKKGVDLTKITKMDFFGPAAKADNAQEWLKKMKATRPDLFRAKEVVAEIRQAPEEIVYS